MPSLGDYTAIREALKTAIVTTWGVKPKSVVFGQPQPQEKRTIDLPYVVCQLQSVPMNPSGPTGTVRSLNQDVAFKLYCAFRKPEANQDPESDKVEKFNSLAVVLEANELFASVGMLPHVAEFNPAEWFEVYEGAHGFTLNFSMLVNRTWGT